MTLYEAQARAASYRAQGVACKLFRAPSGRGWQVCFESGFVEPERKDRAKAPRRSRRK